MNKKVSEKELEYVLCDIRREKNDIIDTDRYEEMDSKSKDELYHKLTTGRPDAERRQYALESYLNYPFIKEYKDCYFIENDFLYYESGNKKIKITADLLTGSKEIIECADKLIICDEKQKSFLDKMISTFCSVVYTRGNCCPVLKNKGGRRGNAGGIETCWYKIGKYIDVNKKYDSILNLEDNNLRTRTADNMFAIFPKELSGREIVDELLLCDYYDDNYELIENRKPADISNVEEYIALLKLGVKLIVQRSVRILHSYKCRKFDNEKRDIVMKVFEDIGLPYDNEKEKSYLMTYENNEVLNP